MATGGAVVAGGTAGREDTGGAAAAGAASAGTPSAGTSAAGAPGGGAETGGAADGGTVGAGAPATAGTGTAGTPAGGAETGGAAGSGAAGAPGVCVPDAACSCGTLAAHHYRFCSTPMWYSNAIADCQQQGMTVAMVDDAAENAWLASEILSRGLLVTNDSRVVLLGGDRLAVSTEWRWLDGTLFWNDGAVAEVYSNWASAPNKGGTSDCLGMKWDGLWVQRACNSGDAFYVCETP